MKRFYSQVVVEPRDDAWQVTLDTRPMRTQRGAQQLVPGEALAQLLAGEWRSQGEQIDFKSFVFRDLADLALDVVAPDRAATIAKLLHFAQTDTLCYRADPGDALFARQDELWEPIVKACESSHDVVFERVSGIIHQAQSEACLGALRTRLESENNFTLSALLTLASLSASLIVALAVLEADADVSALFAAANCEEDWQAELWGLDSEAQKVRALRLAAFEKAAQFVFAVPRP